MTSISPLMAIRAALIAIAQVTPALGLTWWTGVVPAGTATPYAVFSSATDDDATDVPFKKRGALVIDEVSLYADPASSATGEEQVYALYAALRARINHQTVSLGLDALGVPLGMARITLALALIMDDPDVASRAHGVMRATSTVWSA